MGVTEQVGLLWVRASPRRHAADFLALQFAQEAGELRHDFSPLEIVFEFLELDSCDDGVAVGGGEGIAHAAFEDHDFLAHGELDAEAVFGADFWGLAVLADEADAGAADAEVAQVGLDFGGGIGGSLEMDAVAECARFGW